MGELDFKQMIANKVAANMGKPQAEVKQQIDELAKQPAIELPELDEAMLMEIPDVAGTVMGWRTWGIERRGPAEPVLHSATKTSYVWEPREVQTAVCKKGTHLGKIAPEEKCTCGLYSAKDYEHLMSMSYHYYDGEEWGYYTAIGEVANWGKVIEGSQGWRAQHSYPTVLYVPFEAWEFAAPLQNMYGVPVKLKNFLGLEIELPKGDN